MQPSVLQNLSIDGGRALKGEIWPSANKNAVLPVLCATLLSSGSITLKNVPDITDVRKLIEFYKSIGSRIDFDVAAKILTVNHSQAHYDPAVHTLPEGMRASIMLVPPLLSRFGVVCLRGDMRGCTLGSREIDPHIELFSAFGATLESEESRLWLRARQRLRPADHWLDYASVTTTENFVMCAVCANGTSALTNAASEPHVQELCKFMVRIGAVISGAGTSKLTVTSVDQLGDGEFEFEEDFHEVTTFLALGAITKGEVGVRNASPHHFPLIDRTFAKFNIEVTHKDGWSRAAADGALRIKPPFTQHVVQKVEAAPWPYIPADLLPIFVALGVRAPGEIMYWNKVYDGALGWTSELSKFGAHSVHCDPHRVILFGGKPLFPASVESPYIIRVSIALLMIAASIEGRSTIQKAFPVRRAHPSFLENLQNLGAAVEWTA